MTQNELRVLVTGSRDWTNRELIWKVLINLPANTTCIIQGEADGADTIAKEIARGLGMDVEGYYANWKRYGNGAGPIRNKKQAEKDIDLCLAFPIGDEEGGTRKQMKLCKDMGIPVIDCTTEGKEVLLRWLADYAASGAGAAS